MKKLFRTMAAAAMTALAFTGCQNGEPEIPATFDWDNVEFEVAVNVATTGADGSETRAAKTGWKDGDMIVAYFDGDPGNPIFLNYFDNKWTHAFGYMEGGPLNATGSLTALHAGGGVMDVSSHEIAGFSGELLYTPDDSYANYTWNGKSKVSLDITLSRFSTIIRLTGSQNMEDNLGWQLAGDGIKVLKWGTPLSPTAFTADPTAALKGLFHTVDITDDMNVAWADERHTDAYEAVFMVLYEGGPVTLKVRKGGSTIFVREYPNGLPLTPGNATVLYGPIGSGETEDWDDGSEVVAKSVTVGTQVGTVTEGVAGSATFAVTTTGIADGATGEVKFYMSDGESGYSDWTAIVALMGLTANVSNVSSGSATVTVTNAPPLLGSASSVPFTVTIDGVESEMKSFVLSPPAIP